MGKYEVYLEASDNLTVWEKIDSVVSETYNPINDTYSVTIRDTQVLSQGGRFIRLSVSDEE